MTPRATYRLQFHKEFTFADAERLAPYLDQLGISHVYASPITVARRGSSHGYDVVDPTRINPELGGEDAFRSLVTALRRRGMGVIIDIVPNHMGIAGGENRWWNDVLAKGQASAFARYFDIDWRSKVLLPVLGEPLDAALRAGAVKLEQAEGTWVISLYGEQKLPLREEDQTSIHADLALDQLEALLEQQHYRLSIWKAANDELNWRRFFSINELAGVRVEDPDVFEATHALYFRLYREGIIDGVRVDHVDGLTDPQGYCRKLRDRLDSLPRPDDAPSGPAYIVVEKILGAGEKLSPQWRVDGTSGYDFMAEVADLLHAPSGEAALTALWQAVSPRHGDFAAEELRARQEILSWQFDGQLGGCVLAFAVVAASAPETRAFTDGMLRRAIERLMWVFPVYRTYWTPDGAPPTDGAVIASVRERVAPFIPPGEAAVVDAILDWLAGKGPGQPTLAAEAVRRFQQLSAPIAAKSVEDTAFYRYGRLLSRNDVGFDASRMAGSLENFKDACADRAAHFPRGLLATATHDHKRGEDVRARLAVLTEAPDVWRACVERWERMIGPLTAHIDRADRYVLYQTLFGAWPESLAWDDQAGLRAFAERVASWQQKALREAKLRSSWEAPEEAYEKRCRLLVQALLDPGRSSEFLIDLSAFVERTSGPARANTLVQTALRYTCPGVPDLYQGTECADYSLVDPDNRKAVDYSARIALLQEQNAEPTTLSPAKFRLIRQMLELRRAHPSLFAEGTFTALEVAGERAGNIFAFERRADDEAMICAVAIRCASALLGSSKPAPPEAWWGNTAVLPCPGWEHGAQAGKIFARSPVYVEVLHAR